MEDKLEILLDKIKLLENELLHEMEIRQRQFYYEIKRKKVRFEKSVKEQHRLLVKKIRYYLREASLPTILTVPVIWSLVFPALLMDAMVSLYQAVCFPVYGIPRVRRGDYVILDRHYLGYLNGIEKMNCTYCAYFNGLMAYVQEVAARTEQYWCPIKHARKLKTVHNRYKRFLDYGDAEGYREHVETVRRDFSDLVKAKHKSAKTVE